MKALLMIVAMMLVVVPVMAMGTQNYSQDFEGFTPGTYTPQEIGGEWAFGNGNWNVAVNPVLGTNAISPVGGNDLFIPYSDIKFVDGTVVSADMTISSATREEVVWVWDDEEQTTGHEETNIYGPDYFAFNVMDRGGPGQVPFIGLAGGPLLGNNIWVQAGGYGWDMSGTHGTVAVDTKYHIAATLNMTAQTVVYDITDVAAGTTNTITAAFGNPATGEDAGGGGFYLSGFGGTYDNLAVTTPVPEPASLLAICTGMMGIFGFSIRRRK